MTHEFLVAGHDCVLDAVVLEQSLVVETSPDAKDPACILDNPVDMLTHPQKGVFVENKASEKKALEKKISQLADYQRRIQSEEQMQSDSFVRTLDVVESIKGEASNTQRDPLCLVLETSGRTTINSMFARTSKHTNGLQCSHLLDKSDCNNFTDEILWEYHKDHMTLQVEPRAPYHDVCRRLRRPSMKSDDVSAIYNCLLQKSQVCVYDVAWQKSQVRVHDVAERSLKFVPRIQTSRLLLSSSQESERRQSSISVLVHVMT